MPALAYLNRLLPGLQPLLKYRAADLPHDMSAGLAVAAVSIPVAIAYAEIAGLSPSAGLCSSILPLIVYALAGTSGQMITGPDAATCAMIAAVVAPMAAGNSGLPSLEWPDLQLHELGDLARAAAGLALVLFTSGMLTARSVAERNRYDIDVDREFAAFGLANIVAAVSQGFAVPGSSSRTAVNDANGGRR